MRIRLAPKTIIILPNLIISRTNYYLSIENKLLLAIFNIRQIYNITQTFQYIRGQSYKNYHFSFFPMMFPWSKSLVLKTELRVLQA